MAPPSSWALLESKRSWDPGYRLRTEKLSRAIPPPYTAVLFLKYTTLDCKMLTSATAAVIVLPSFSVKEAYREMYNSIPRASMTPENFDKEVLEYFTTSLFLVKEHAWKATVKMLDFNFELLYEVKKVAAPATAVFPIHVQLVNTRLLCVSLPVVKTAPPKEAEL